MRAMLVVIGTLCVALLGCGNSSKDNQQSPGTAPAPAPPSFAAAIEKGEADGTLPKLNRDSTLTGPDSDRNGVRDDIDAYIDALSDTAPQKLALRQNAAALTNALTVSTSDKTALTAVANAIAASNACLYSRYGDDVASNRSRDIEKFSINTKLRFSAYAKFNSSISGMSFVLPQGDGCAN